MEVLEEKSKNFMRKQKQETSHENNFTMKINMHQLYRKGNMIVVKYLVQ